MKLFERPKQILEENKGDKTKAIKQLHEEAKIPLKEANKIISSIENETTASKGSKLSTIISSKIVYKGGHPNINKEKNCTLDIKDDALTINCGLSGMAIIPYYDVVGVHYETSDQIEKRITATRIALLGPFALAFKKKKK